MNRSGSLKTADWLGRTQRPRSRRSRHSLMKTCVHMRPRPRRYPRSRILHCSALQASRQVQRHSTRPSSPAEVVAIVPYSARLRLTGQRCLPALRTLSNPPRSLADSAEASRPCALTPSGAPTEVMLIWQTAHRLSMKKHAWNIFARCSWRSTTGNLAQTFTMPTARWLITPLLRIHIRNVCIRGTSPTFWAISV